MVFQHPWDEKKLLVRRVKSFYQAGSTKDSQLVGGASETLNGGIDSRTFGPIPVSSILARAIYYYNNDYVRMAASSNA